MSKSIRSYPESQRTAVAKRRVAAKTMGLGYLSALAFLVRAGQAAKAEAEVKAEPESAE